MEDIHRKMSNSQRWLKHLLKYPLQVDQKKKGGMEARYGAVSRKTRENKSKVCYADLSQCLLH